MHGTMSCRRRPSDLWFDAECRHAKRRVRRFERAARSATLADASSTCALDSRTAHLPGPAAPEA